MFLQVITIPRNNCLGVCHTLKGDGCGQVIWMCNSHMMEIVRMGGLWGVYDVHRKGIGNIGKVCHWALKYILFWHPATPRASERHRKAFDQKQPRLSPALWHLEWICLNMWSIDWMFLLACCLGVSVHVLPPVGFFLWYRLIFTLDLDIPPNGDFGCSWGSISVCLWGDVSVPSPTEGRGKTNGNKDGVDKEWQHTFVFGGCCFIVVVNEHMQCHRRIRRNLIQSFHLSMLYVPGKWHNSSLNGMDV